MNRFDTLSRHFGLACVTAFCILAGVSPALGQRSSKEDFKKIFEASLRAINLESDEKQAALDQHYVDALARLEKKLQAEGKLTELVQVREERKLFEKSRTSGTAELPEIVALRSKLVEVSQPIEDERIQETMKLAKAYIRRLEPLLIALTKAGDVEQALAVKADLDQAKLLITEGRAPSLPGGGSKVSLPNGSESFTAVPTINPPVAGKDIFEQEKWPLQVALPKSNYRIKGNTSLVSAKGRELLIAPESTFRGTGDDPLWNLGNSLTVAKNVEFDGFRMFGNLGSRIFLENCSLKDMDIGKGGGWFGGRFMSRWQFRSCAITGSFAKRWQSRQLGVQMTDCTVERVEFAPIEYDATDEPSEYALHELATIRDTRFRKCVIPVSVLSLMEDCSFDDCRFIDDPTPVNFARSVHRVIYVKDCKWLIKKMPANLVVEQKPLSAER